MRGRCGHQAKKRAAWAAATDVVFVAACMPRISPARAALSDAAAAENKTQAVHRWVPWIAGYSADFVRDALDAYLPLRRRAEALVLDPFAGVATTLVEALKAGCDAVGYDVNAWPVLAARAKLQCVDVPPERFGAEIAEFRTALAQFEVEVDRRWAADGDDGIAEVMRHHGLARPPAFRSRIPLFGAPVEAKFLFALGRLAVLPSPDQLLFRAALGASLIAVSNYSYEPSLSTRPSAGKALVRNASVVLPLGQKLQEMLADCVWASERYGPVWRGRRREVQHRSYFTSDLAPGSVALLLTSPPYMNNYHYVRNTRPQLHWLDLLSRPGELREYEEANFGKFWQTVRQAPAIAACFDLPPLQALIERLRGLSAEKGPYGGPGWANYVTSYFNDTGRLLATMRPQLAPGAAAIVVVGNSIIQGIEFQVDQLLAELAPAYGLRVEEVRIVRTKRVGNSIIGSSVRNGSSPGPKMQLYDAAVILRG
jgi:hypothetical protein